MVKYKSRAPKAQLTSQEADAKAKEAAEEAARVESLRIEAECQEARRKRQEWEARPGPTPIGWDSAVDPASGLEFYWQLDNNKSTTTWDRPAPAGEKIEAEDLEALLKEFRHTDKIPRPGMFALCLQRLWDWEDVDPVCNIERPGAKDVQEMVVGLTLLRYLLRGPRKRYQELLAIARHAPHEKLPPYLHHATALDRLVDLLRHDEEDVKQASANAIAAACYGGHRACQDAIAMGGNSMPLLINMLWDEQTLKAACLAIGRLCERAHRHNQDALAMVPQGIERIFKFLEHEDEEVALAVHFCIFWACSGATRATRGKWEMSRGLCLALVQPKEAAPREQRRKSQAQSQAQPVLSIANRSTLKGDLLSQGHCKKTLQAANLEIRKTTVTMAEKVLALFDKVPEPEDVPFNNIAKKKAKQGKQLHPPVSSHQDPSHVHMRLATKRAITEQHQHETRHEERVASKLQIAESRAATKQLASRAATKALCDGETSMARRIDLKWMALAKALCDSGDKDSLNEDSLELALPDDGRNHHTSLLAWEYGDVVPIANDETSSEEEDHDLHHLDPGLDDSHICRIGGEARFVAPTGFLHPSNANKRLGICT